MQRVLCDNDHSTYTLLRQQHTSKVDPPTQYNDERGGDDGICKDATKKLYLLGDSFFFKILNVFSWVMKQPINYTLDVQ